SPPARSSAGAGIWVSWRLPVGQSRFVMFFSAVFDVVSVAATWGRMTPPRGTAVKGELRPRGAFSGGFLAAGAGDRTEARRARARARQLGRGADPQGRRRQPPGDAGPVRAPPRPGLSLHIAADRQCRDRGGSDQRRVPERVATG